MNEKKPPTYPRVETRKLTTLKAHPDGVRVKDKNAEYFVGKSYELFGLIGLPTLNVRTGTVIDGDTILNQLRMRGVSEVMVLCVDIPEELEDLAHLAKNNHAGDWHWQAVSELLKIIEERKQPIGVSGFHESDTGPLLAADWKAAAVGPLDGTDASQGVML